MSSPPRLQASCKSVDSYPLMMLEEDEEEAVTFFCLPRDTQLHILSYISPRNVLRLVSKRMQIRVQELTTSLKWHHSYAIPSSAHVLLCLTSPPLKVPLSLPSCPALHTLDLCNTGALSVLPSNLPATLRVINLSCTSVHNLMPISACVRLQSLTFDSAEMVQSWEPLASCLDLRTLLISGITGHQRARDLSPLSTCTRLEHVRLRKIRMLNVAILSPCINLHTLNISGVDTSVQATILNLRSITHLQSITSLDIVGQRVADIPDVLQYFRNLTSLDACTTGGLSTVVSLSTLNNLRRLDLSFTQVHDISPLRRCITLTSLLCNGTEVHDISALSACSSLQVLQLSRCKQLRHLPAIPSLTMINLDYNSLASLNALPQCSLLRNLMLTGCQVVGNDFSPLSACTSLTSLDISHTAFEDLSLLQSCTSLQYLYLQHTPITDFSPLSMFTALKDLDLARTKLSTLPVLAPCSLLVQLCLESCPQLTDISTLTSYPSLQRLDLRYSNIHDLSPLASCSVLSELVLNSMQQPGLARDASVMCPHVRVTQFGFGNLKRT